MRELSRDPKSNTKYGGTSRLSEPTIDGLAQTSDLLIARRSANTQPAFDLGFSHPIQQVQQQADSTGNRQAAADFDFQPVLAANDMA